jgi:hypothetical protein
MEDYTAEDLPAVVRCRRDVANCDIYVCIWGYKYGTVVNDGRGLSFTHHEFEEATDKKIQRLIFLKTFPPESKIIDDNDNLRVLKDVISNREQLLTKSFDDDSKLPDLILKALDKYIVSFKEDVERRKTEREALIRTHVDYNKIYLCDRQPQDSFFDKKRREVKDPLQFYLIKCHENDMPHFFIERKKLEFEDREIKTIELFVQPAVLEDDNDYESVEFAIKKAILKVWNKMPVFDKHKFRDEDEVTPQKALEVLDALQEYKYLLIAWNIQSIYWKNDKLQEHISTFYKKCNDLNKSIRTDKKIFFFGMLTYTAESPISRNEFEQRIDKIEYGNVFPPFPLIKTVDIKTWLSENEIEDNPEDQRIIIASSVPDKNRNEYFLSELEKPLRTILEKVYLQSKNI